MKLYINLKQNRNFLDDFSVSEKKGIWNYDPINRLSHIDINKLQWSDGNKVKAEKVLEAWLMKHLKDKNNPLSLIFPSDSKIIWIGNYLPFGVLGNNIDIVILYSHNNILHSFVIELKKDKLTYNGWKNTIDEVNRYSNFISRAVFTYRNNRVVPVIISHKEGIPDNNIHSYANNTKPNPTLLINYTIKDGEIVFDFF
ncbi:MAG: hypothetical protein AB2L26_01685 [Ignavibacteria bacterium]